MQQILQRQKEYFASGATLPVKNRIAALKRLRSVIYANEQLIYDALKADLGKSATESYMCEVGMTLSEISHMLRHIKGYARSKRAATPLAQYIAKSYVKKSPYGCVLIMSPWNYPFMLTLEPLVDALAAGNTAVIKPSAYSPATGKVIAELISQAFKPEHVAVVLGGRAENSALLDMSFDKIFFTGSVSVGKEVMRRAAEKLIPVTLELGGKSPCLVDNSANIDLAARRIVWGKFLNAGQTCVAPDYLLVHQNVKGPLVDRIRHWIDVFYGPDPKESPHFGRLVNESAYRRVASYLTDGSLLAGGETDPAQRYIAPTLLDLGTPTDSVPVMQAEIFGPILPVMEYVHLDQAIEFVNRHEKPLALYYFGAPRTGREVLRRTSSGGACINDTILHISNDHLPFGGVGRSGMGRYHGKASFETFSNRRSVLISLRNSDLPFKYPPYKYFKLIQKLLHL